MKTSVTNDSLQIFPVFSPILKLLVLFLGTYIPKYFPFALIETLSVLKHLKMYLDYVITIAILTGLNIFGDE